MLFMVELDAGMEKANAVDAAGGPGKLLTKLRDPSSRRRSIARRLSAAPTLSLIWSQPPTSPS
jgi:hypothetical protein